jgi:LytS/YehU family sensor histidine kinase
VLYKKDQKTYINKLITKSSFDSIAIEITKPDFFKYPFAFDPLEAKISPAVNIPPHIKDDEIVLKGLTPKNYKLNISNTHGKTLETKIEIKRDFTLLLNIIGLILLSTLISSFFIKRHKYLEREKSKINQRISALQLSSLQSQMNPHFIFNSLGAIQYFIQTNNIEKADDYLSNFAQLMRMILEASKSKFISLKNEIKLMDLYISLEEVRFESMFNYKIDIDPRIDLEFNIPPMIIQPYIENAVNHGLYNLKDKEGKLELSLLYIDGNTIEVKIRDNGIGRKKATELRNKNHKSRGMQIVNERIETFNNTERFSVNVEIYDHEGDDNNSLGTEVIIRCTDFEA